MYNNVVSDNRTAENKHTVTIRTTTVSAARVRELRCVINNNKII